MGSARAPVALRFIGALAPAAFLAVFFAYPLVSVIARGFEQTPSIGIRSLIGVVWFTLWQAAASTALALAVGLPAAAALRITRGRAAAAARAVILVPFVLPTVVVGAAVNSLFSTLSLSSPIAAILIAHTVFNVAVVVRVVGSFWSLLDPRHEQAAATMGAAPLTVFRTVTLPRIRVPVMAAAAIVFLFCFTSFGVILIVGSPARATIETEIWRYATQRTDFASAALLTIVQLVFVIALVALTGHLERRLGQTERALTTPNRRPRRWAPALQLLPACALIGPVLALLVERALATPTGHGLGNFRRLGERQGAGATLLVPPLQAVRNSLLIATAAAMIATALGAMAAASASTGRRFGPALDRALMLPLGVSAVTLGFGFIIALDEPPLDLRTSWWLIPVAQSLVGLPFVLRIAVPALRAIDPRLRAAAAMLGADPTQVWRAVDWPVLRRALAVGWLFSFAVALGEFGATSFLARPDNPTVPVAIFRLLSRPGPGLRGMAMALSLVLSLLVISASLLSERLRPPGSATL